MMGSGKTSVGRDLARLLHARFLDTDEWIAMRQGRSIPDLFREGEDAFRRIEREAVREVVQEAPAVIALGGGSLQDWDTATHLKEHGLLVFLDAPVELILDRLEGVSGRPMLDAQGAMKTGAAQDDEAQQGTEAEKTRSERRLRIQTLLDRRRPLYETAGLHIRVQPGQTIGQIATMILQGLDPSFRAAVTSAPGNSMLHWNGDEPAQGADAVAQSLNRTYERP